MKNIPLVSCVLLVCVSSLFADLYSPNRKLSIARTEFFDIIYPEESKNSAAYLARFADDAYREIAGLLQTKPKTRITVVITPDPEELNGYYTPYPFPKIVLYEAAIDPNENLGSFQDDLYKLFYHELTHAVSLGIRGKLQDVLVKVFGSPLGLSNYLAPLSFVEGVTVSFESRDGFGRAADPLAAGIIRQDILEGDFKTWEQAAGAWDGYPYGSYYIYGGYFSAYLQERFGMEAYADLWKRIGTGMVFKPLRKGLFSQGHFREAFGVSLDEAWEDFRRSMELRDPVYMAAEALRGLSIVDALSANGRKLCFHDRHSGCVTEIDPGEGTERSLFRLSGNVTRISSSSDGGKILLSAVSEQGGFDKLALLEFDTVTGKLETLSQERLRDACYGQNGSIFAVRITGFLTDIVRIRDGKIEPILEGGRRISYSSPVYIPEEESLYALARIEGCQSIIRIESGKVSRLVLPEQITALRYLSADGRKLLSAWDDGKLYRLLIVSDGEVEYQTVPISGGVHEPVGIGGNIYYLGRFSRGLAPCSLPKDREVLGFKRLPAEWEDISGETLSRSVGEDSPDSQPQNTGRYTPLIWLFPRFWHPSFQIDESGLKNAGAVFYINDPIERMGMAGYAAWNPGAEAVDIEAEVSWQAWDPFISIHLKDLFSAEDSRIKRESGLTLALTDSIPSMRGGIFSWTLAGQIDAFADSGIGDPYSPWSTEIYHARAVLSWEDFRTGHEPGPLAYGYGFGVLGRALFCGPASENQSAFTLEGSLTLSPPLLGLCLEMNAAWILGGDAAYGAEGISWKNWNIQSGYPIFSEFAGGPTAKSYIQGSISICPLSAEIGKSVSVLYANRLRLLLGARGYILPDSDTGFDYSLFGRLELVFTPVVGRLAEARPILGAELHYLPSTETFGFSFGFSPLF